MPPDVQELIARVRDECGLNAGIGPNDDQIAQGVKAFVETFDFRYVQVVRKSVRKYRSVIIERINPLIRRFQLEGLAAAQVAGRLVDDWSARNFVTAGGFAIEALAVGLSKNAEKSSTEGVDLQRFDSTNHTYNLYVFKSGPVTRNSDILKALKTNSRKAEKILRSDRSVNGVTANYAIASGRTSPTSFEDGVRRPSTQDLWADISDLEPGAAVDLVLAMAAQAGKLIRQDVDDPLEGLKILVESYIGDLDDPSQADWRWIERRTMRERANWNAEDKARNALAVEALASAGFDLDGDHLQPGEPPPNPLETEIAEGELDR